MPKPKRRKIARGSAYQSNIGSDNTAVAQVRQQLAAAKYNLDQSVVHAPCDGYAVNMQIEPGAVVGAAASVLPLVCDRDERNLGMVVATFMQGPYLQIKPGEYAEVVFPMYPGRVFPGKVVTTIDVASEGRLTGGMFIFRALATPATRDLRFIIQLDDAEGLGSSRNTRRCRNLHRQRADLGHHSYGADA